MISTRLFVSQDEVTVRYSLPPREGVFQSGAHIFDHAERRCSRRIAGRKGYFSLKECTGFAKFISSNLLVLRLTEIRESELLTS